MMRSDARHDMRRATSKVRLPQRHDENQSAFSRVGSPKGEVPACGCGCGCAWLSKALGHGHVKVRHNTAHYTVT
jgi:hypothetical protein